MVERGSPASYVYMQYIVMCNVHVFNVYLSMILILASDI